MSTRSLTDPGASADPGAGAGTRSAARSTGSLTFLRVAAVLALLSLAFQFVTAGGLLSSRDASPEVHGAGAVVLHVVTGLTVLAALLHRRARRTGWAPVVVAALVFVLTFVQAALGDAGVMAAHVPGAMALTVGAVWLAAWAFGAGARR